MEQEDRDNRIRKRAYALWEQDGRPEGDPERHWHQAITQIDGALGLGHPGQSHDDQSSAMLDSEQGGTH
jgi:hypothetical protein